MFTEDKLNSILELTENGLFAFKKEKYIGDSILLSGVNLKLNDAETLEYSDYLGKSLVDIFHQVDISKYIYDDKIAEFNTYYYARDGESFVVNVKGYIEEDKVILVLSNNTRIHRLQEKLHKLHVKLNIKEKKLEVIKDSKEAVEKFTSQTIHDLKTPLTSIMGFSEVLRDNISAEELSKDEKHEILEVILRNTNTLEELVTEILDVSKAKTVNVEKEKVSYKELFNSLMNEFDYSVKMEQLTFSTEFEDSFIETNELLLKSVFRNLISNSIKYSHDNQEKHVSIKQTSKDGIHTIMIKDNGLGIAKEDLGSVFNAYKRLKSNKKGHGLGLHICREIVERLGGSINVDSKIGQWTEFTIRV